MLRHRVDDSAVEHAELHPHAMSVDLDLTERSLQLIAPGVGDADAERRRVGEQRTSDGLFGLESRHRGDLHAGSALLHLHGSGPYVQGAGRSAGVHHIGNQLRKEIVEARCEERHIRVRERGVLGPEDDAKEVRA